jgi:O-methyltransferase involved in polyketide biosynthesis
MSNKIELGLGAVQETLLLPLWGRAIETQKMHPMLKDPTAAEIVGRIDYDFSTIAANINPITRYAWIARSIHFDHTIRGFLHSYPKATVVNIGCGLDTTFERTDNGTLSWYDLDLPDVISLRRRFMQETDRRKFLACSVLDESWVNQLRVIDNVFFLAAGVLYYLEESQVKKLFAMLADRFPGSEIAFDAASPLGVRVANARVIKAGGMDEASILNWGIKDVCSIQSWDERFRLVEEYPMFRGARKGLGFMLKLGTIESDLLRIMSIVHLKFSTH